MASTATASSSSARDLTELRANPVWAALSSAQAHLALGAARMKRYPADVAPFVAVPSEAAGADASEALAALTERDESVVFVGPAPALDARFEIEQRARVLQMDATRPGAGGERFTELGADAAEAMLALTGLVYPGYFRHRTYLMGRYFGVYDADRRLVAMAGERMRTSDACEVSGVCTHPDFLGRGLARRLVEHVVAAIQAHGEHAFLHVSPENTRAVKLYEMLDFVIAAELDLMRVRRVA